MIPDVIANFCNGMAFMFFVVTVYQLAIIKRKNRMHILLIAIMSFWGLIELKNLVLGVINLPALPFIKQSIFVIDGWLALASSFFLFELTRPGWFNFKRCIICTLSFILFTAIYFIWPSYTSFIIYWVFISIYAITSVCITYYSWSKYRAYIRNYYSYDDSINLRWLYKATILMLCYLFIWIIFNTFITWEWIYSIYYLVSIALWSYTLKKTEKMINSENHIDIDDEDSKEETYNDDFKDEYGLGIHLAAELERLMKDEKLYLNPGLTINDVANAVGTNRTYLSQYFNNNLNTNFYEYINHHRIEYAGKPLIHDEKQLTVEEVAQQSGFNSTSTFRRAFIKNTGMTPLQYRKTTSQ